MLRLAQASSSETFERYGISPNQRRTGVTPENPAGNMDGELNIIEFYGGWEYVIRPIDPKRAEFIATFAEHTVANGSHIGYNWGDTSLFDYLKKNGKTDPADVLALVNVDCGTMAGAEVYFSGVHIEKLRTLCTWQIEEVLIPTGLFIKLTDKELLDNGKGLKRGDILVKTGHTATAIDSDGASWSRLVLDESGLNFYDALGDLTATYPAVPARMLKDNELRTKDLAGNSWYTFNEAGTVTVHLVSDRTYLVVLCNRNSTRSDCDIAAIVAAHRDNSHIITLHNGGKSKISVSGLSLSVKRGCAYGRLSVTALT